MRRDGGSPRAGGRDVTVRPVVTVIGGDRRHEALRVGGRRGIMCTLRDSESLSGTVTVRVTVRVTAARSGGLGPRLTQWQTGRRGKSLNTASAASLRSTSRAVKFRLVLQYRD